VEGRPLIANDGERSDRACPAREALVVIGDRPHRPSIPVDVLGDGVLRLPPVAAVAIGPEPHKAGLRPSGRLVFFSLQVKGHPFYTAIDVMCLGGDGDFPGKHLIAHR